MSKVEQEKILYIGGFELPDKNAAAHRVLANGKILDNLGYEVIYLGVSHENECSDNVVSTSRKVKYGLDYRYKYPIGKINWLKYIMKIGHIIELIEIHKVKVVIAYNYPAIALHRLHLYCKKNDIKLVSDCTEWYVPVGDFIFRIIKGLDTYLRMRVVQPRLDGMIAISKFLFDFYYPKQSNLILVPPLVDLSDSKWHVNVEKNDNKQLQFLYAGSPGGKTKDHLGMIISSLILLHEKKGRDFCLDIIGITKEQYNEIWCDHPINSSLNDKIKFHGKLSNGSVIKKLKKVDFSIFIREDNLVTRAGFPTKFVESISAGIPVLTNSSSNVKDYLEEGVNGFLLDISSTEILAESLDEVFNTNGIDINNMKLNCMQDKQFDCNNYSEDFAKLMSSFKNK